MIYMTLSIPDALSVDSGFESLDQVLFTLGMPTGTLTPRMAIYEGVTFSDFAFRLDAPVINT